MLERPHHVPVRSRTMLLRIVLVLLAGIAAMILVNPSGTDFHEDPVEGPGGVPTIGEVAGLRGAAVPFLP